MTTRRQFLAAGGAVAALPLLARPARAATTPVKWGCSLPYPQTTTKYSGLTPSQTDAGKHMPVAGFYGHWLDGGGYSPFPKSTMDYLWANGTTPNYCWQVTNADQGADGNSLTAASVLNGTHDAYLDEWVAAAKAWGHQFQVRILHEFDGDWYSWGIGNNDWTVANHIAVWQHVVHRFHTAGATNVRFVWCPSRVTAANESVITAAYPQDYWVDYVACDGYNFGSFDGHSWQSVEQVFDRTLLTVFPRLAPAKPVMIAEVACAEDPASGDKSAWVRHFWGILYNRYPTVVAAYWMQDTNRGNYFESDADATTAFRNGIALSAYQPS